MVGAVTLPLLPAAGIPTVLAWRDDEPGGDSTDGYGVAIGKVANGSDAEGGTLKFTGGQDADSWDPQRGYFSFMWNFARYYARQLVT
ncbi:hypothetical protein [Streptomyces sp. NPDC006368]|uniref:hypothetical protein n=1 Tax=Streptomyces sp. NPDC006368 TaxID=3156760 RepID=UPI0033BFA0BC